MDNLLNVVYQDIYFYLEIFGKIFMAVVLGGLIGIERESMHRPAGFRTHILVCVGSALVMITSEYIFNRYHQLTNVDPARLGAQVISGIGFLGAGTIIRDGVTVKGLTTAASLWAVSCIGLAVGIGFYSGAIITSIIVYIVLITLKNLTFREIGVSSSKKAFRHLTLKLEIDEGMLGTVEKIFQESKVRIRGLKYLNNEDGINIIKFFLVLDNPRQYDEILEALDNAEGIKRVVQY